MTDTLSHKVRAGEYCYCQVLTYRGTCGAENPCRWHDADWREHRIGNRGLTVLRRQLRSPAFREALMPVLDALEDAATCKPASDPP